MIRYDILICGVGGQGVISLGTVLKLAAVREGLTVAGAERRGGAQREGVVTSNIRYRGLRQGEQYSEREMAVSGLIPTAGADMMISMEPMEALRHARFLHERSVVIVNESPLIPVSVRTGERDYPAASDMYARLREFTPEVHVFAIDELSRKNFDSLRQVNTISLGLAFELGGMPLSEESLLSTVKEQFPGYAANRSAFLLGRDMARAGKTAIHPRE
jgi:indolepyruvate ferredoxin oxidoreductase beta subunit